MRFFNSEFNFSERQLGVVLRSVQESNIDARRIFFDEVRSCRRRAQRDVRTTSLSPVFKMQDEFSLFEFRSIIVAIRYLLHKKGLGALDAFRTFDVQRDGILYCAELYGGLEWLGLKLLPEDIYAIVRYIDSTGEGRIRYNDFAKCFGDPEKDDTLGFLEAASEVYGGKGNVVQRPVIELKAIKELYEVKVLEERKVVKEIDAEILTKMKVKCKQVEHWAFVWDTTATKARKPISVWAPDLETFQKKQNLRRNKVRTCIGHYTITKVAKRSGNKRKPPSGLTGLTVDMTDRNTNRLFKSNNLSEAHVNHLMPHPLKYKKVWSKLGGEVPLHVWRAVPPDNFVAIGMIATQVDDPPPITAMRCVPRRWVKQVTDPPELVWEDSGTGGKRGSFWAVNSLRLLWVTEGHDPPEGPFYDIVANKLYASEFYQKDAHSSLFQVDMPMSEEYLKAMADGKDSDSEGVMEEIDENGHAVKRRISEPAQDMKQDSDENFAAKAGTEQRKRGASKAPAVANIFGSPKDQEVELSQSSPAPLPPGWSEEYDESSASYYYYNEQTGVTQWERPAAPVLPVKPATIKVTPSPATATTPAPAATTAKPVTSSAPASTLAKPATATSSTTATSAAASAANQAKGGLKALTAALQKGSTRDVKKSNAPVNAASSGASSLLSSPVQSPHVRDASPSTRSVDSLESNVSVKSVALPKGWQQLTDPDSGEPYYFNEFTQVTQWERPT
eukprot:TRINITY_DN5365_c0_g1_i1.p1 TRINITY_DN5365_c0_g1~~TRINITY_DN5365_c0_g1_i1.p1  ORF type:complete len:729 (-),score=163.84 TRINITY_DN5365_c0_g1_i1:71-2257(-)